MKKVTLVVAIVLFTVLVTAQFLGGDSSKTSVYYAPHADDEVLSLGGAILDDINKGHEVVVVLLSHGKASRSINEVNSKLVDQDITTLSIEDFGAARVEEFKKAVKRLGVLEENTFVYNLSDGGFRIDEVKKIMIEMNELYPKASHHTLTYKDPHSDHSKAGSALKKLLDEEKISTGRFYIPIQEFENMEYSGVKSVPAHLLNDYINSLEAYNLWDPDNGFYAIGQTSVKPYFIAAIEYRESRWHELE